MLHPTILFGDYPLPSGFPYQLAVLLEGNYSVSDTISGRFKLHVFMHQFTLVLSGLISDGIDGNDTKSIT